MDHIRYNDANRQPDADVKWSAPDRARFFLRAGMPALRKKEPVFF